MAVTTNYVAYIEDQLSYFDDFTTRKMFGGLGYYKEGVMFGLLGNDTFCLKADESNIPDFEKYGMKAFMFSEKKKGMPYWQVPVEILEDANELSLWATKAFNLMNSPRLCLGVS